MTKTRGRRPTRPRPHNTPRPHPAPGSSQPGSSQFQPGSFQIVSISPPGYLHSAALAEVVETVYYGLRALGYEADRCLNRVVAPGPQPVLFGAHLLGADDLPRVPPGTIIYNLEQISPSSSWCSPPYLKLLKTCRVWDYSPRNIATLAQMGVRGNVTRVPIGYVPQLTRIPASSEEDIDVLFYGSINDRRARVLNDLRAMGLNVHAVFGVYGHERDALMSRAKVVLNLHFYDTSIFEVVRVSYALANRKAVVSEYRPGTEMDADMVDAVRLVPYDKLVTSCAELVSDVEARRALGARGFARISERDEATYLASALGQPHLAQGSVA